MKKALINFQNMKKEGAIVAWITAYNYWQGIIAEKSECDFILCGDSGFMTERGYPNTNFANMDGMIDICKSVRKGAPNTYICGDMPSQSYEESNNVAIRNALRFIKEGETDCIKLENGTETILERIKAISDIGVVVCCHLGLVPQSKNAFSGYRVQGKTLESFENIYKQSLSVEKNGANMLLLEAVPEEVGQQITKSLKIPVYSIGGGKLTDGQLLILSDALGLYPNFRPLFAKNFIPDVIDEFSAYIKSFDDLIKLGKDTRTDGLLYLSELAIKKYVSEVKNKIFPNDNYRYKLKQEELNELRKSDYWNSKLE